MQDSRLDRLAPLSGLLTVVLLVAGAAIIGIYDYLPEGDQLVAAFGGSSARLFAGGYLGTLAAFLLMWFGAATAKALKQAEGPGGWLGQLAFGGAIASAVSLGVGFSALIATGARVTAAGGITPIMAVTLYDFYGQVLGGMFGMTMAVFIAATALVSRRRSLLPAWFDWVSLFVAIGMLTPIAYLLLLLALVWLVVVSIWLYRRGTAAGSRAAASG